MAKFSSLVLNRVSGKLGDLVLNKNGTARARVSAKNPNTPAQQAVRSGFTDGNLAWKALTPPQQLAWSVLSKKITLFNEVGKQYNPTARGLYLSCFQNTRTLGVTPPGDAPALPLLVPPVGGFTLTVTGPEAGLPDGHIALAGSFDLQNYSCVLRATGPLAPDRNALKPSDYRVLLPLPRGASLPTPVGLAILYTAKYGVLQLGMKVSFEAFLVDASGFAGGAVRADAVARPPSLSAADPAEADSGEGLRKAA